MTKKAIVSSWLDSYYNYNYKTIRAIWYAMKPVMQVHDITDTQATRIIGQWLWSHFEEGNRDIYGAIGNSQRVKTNKLPIILFCEKNTLDPFSGIEEYIYANSYHSSGQTNLYEIANLIKNIGKREVIWVYVATDFDKAGTDIGNALLNHLSKFYKVMFMKLNVDISKYETYIQPSGEVGLELDAIQDLQELVSSDLERFLPYEIFEDVAKEERLHEVYQELLKKDDEHQLLLKQVSESENRVWYVATNYKYDYCLHSDLWNLSTRVEVEK